MIHALAVPAPSHHEVQPQQTARDNALRTRDLHCNNFAHVDYSKDSDNEYLSAFFIRRSLLSVAWARSCLVLYFTLKNGYLFNFPKRK